MRVADAHALLLFLGGQDSAICLAWTLDRFARGETIGFDYGLRHAIEMPCREVVLARMRREFPHCAERLGADHRIDLTALASIGDSALTTNAQIALGEPGLPNTFVPGHNLLFFTLAAAMAYRRSIKVLVGGMCEIDYSGYPDCRDDALKALQAAINLGMATRFVIETPCTVAIWVSATGSSIGGAAAELAQRANCARRVLRDGATATP